MENFQDIDTELKELLRDLENVKLTVDLFGKFVEKQLTTAAV